ncbi:MAG TPA: hypothetical protein VJ965_01700 [Anaerolineales bacterium]|nr:hypothetical protein [Anaerolineales bacterium]
MEEDKDLTPQEPTEEPNKEQTEPPEPAARPEETPPSPEPEGIDMPEHPLVNGDQDLTDTPTPVDEALEESKAEKEPTKFQLFMHKALIWSGVVVGAALVGFLAFYFAFFRPQAAELQTAEDDLTAAKSQIATQDAASAEMNQMLTQLEDAEFHATLLDISTDVYAARLALADDNTVAAKAALANTEIKISGIKDDLAAFDARLAENLPQRLSLIRSSIDSDIENAIADCDILLGDLSEAEDALMP